MPVSTVHKLDKLVIGGWSAAIDIVTIFRQSPQITSRIVHPSGHVYPLYRGNEIQPARITFTTPQIDVVLNNCGLTGYETATDSTLYYKLATATGSAARNATSHKKFTVSKVFVFWDNIQLNDQGQGTVDVTVIPVWDTSNEPIVPAGSSALSSTQAAGTEYKTGPANINSSALPGVQSISFRNNCNVVELRAGGENWTTYAYCETAQQIIVINTVEAVALSTFGFDGTALDGSNGLKFYARKNDIAPATEEHIEFVATHGAVLPEESGVDRTTGHITDSIRIEAISPNDSTAPVTWDITADIP
jgi:hypothetical protein